MIEGLPLDAIGLKLHKIVGEKLLACESVFFTAGASAVNTVLRRAAISGRVEIGGEIGDFFADILTDHDGTWSETVALDSDSYRSLKNHWMRCKLEPES